MARQVYRGTVADLLVRHRYDELEQLGVAAAKPGAMLAPPERTYVDFYMVFHTNFHFPRKIDWEDEQDEVRAWAAARPKSAVAQLALAHNQLAAAWLAMGRRDLKGLSALALRKSVQKLVDRAGELDQSPPWWWVRMELALLSGATPEELEVLRQEAVVLDPSDAMPYAQLALSHIPAWHGKSDGEWMKVAELMPKSMPGHLALLDLTMTGMLGDAGPWHADWPAQAAAAKELAAAYPRSAYAASLYLYSAMAANQADREAFSAVEGRADSRLLNYWDRYRQARHGMGSLPPSPLPLPELTPPPENYEALRQYILEQQVTVLLLSQRFAELEAAFPQLLPQRTASGGFVAWNLVEGVAGEGEDWRVKRCAEWRQAYPKSDLARIASACTLKEAAWQARGGGYAHTVSEEGNNTFQARLEEADALLHEVTSLTPWRVAAQLPVSMGLNAPAPTYRELCEEALQADPEFRVPVMGAAYALLPRWHGEPGDTEKLAAWAADFAHRPGLYAYAANSVVGFTQETNGFQWARLKASFEDLIRRFPKTNRWLNAYARFAVLEGDRATARQLFRRLGANYDPDVWFYPEFATARAAVK